MATFEQRTSSWWQAKVRRKGQPTQSKTFEKKSDAEAWARAIESEIDKGAFVSRNLAERTMLKDIIKRFQEEFAPHHYRTREDQHESWKTQLRHLERVLGDYAIVAITSPVVAKYRDDRLKLVSGATVKKELNMLSKVLTVSMQEFGIPLPFGNPVSTIRKPKESKSRDRRLNAEEFERLKTECDKSRNPWMAFAVSLAVETAMRQGELLSLEWQHVDQKRRLAHLVDEDKIKNGERRSVPLSSAAIATIKKMPPSVSGKVLPIRRMTLASSFRSACARAKITNFRFHDLRHEALSRLAERGDFSMLEMAAISGHKTLQMLKRYTHLQAELLAKKLG